MIFDDVIDDDCRRRLSTTTVRHRAFSSSSFPRVRRDRIAPNRRSFVRSFVVERERECLGHTIGRSVTPSVGRIWSVTPSVGRPALRPRRMTQRRVRTQATAKGDENVRSYPSRRRSPSTRHCSTKTNERARARGTRSIASSARTVPRGTFFSIVRSSTRVDDR